MADFNRFHKAVAYIDSLSNLPLFAEYMKQGEQPDPQIFLDRMRYFLKLLDNPEKDFKFIHVTGTAGKGTVATMIHNILGESGKLCGLFTSPFVVSPIEKIQVGDLYISPDEFSDLVEKIKPAVDVAYSLGEFGRPSHFEIYFAVALLYFKQKKCEWAVLEVGCGGRFDATNVIKPPEAAIITCIDYDHTEVLGKTLNKIAFDKAGIIKKGSRFFTAETRPALLKMFLKIAKKHGANFERVHVPRGTDANKVLASRVSEALGFSDFDIARGLSKTFLPARFEVVSRKPLVIVDGAHNRAKIAHTLSRLKKESFKKLFLVISIADNKDSHDILGQVLPMADTVYLTRFSSKERKPAPPIRLLKEAKPYIKNGAKVRMFLDPAEALTAAQSEAGREDCILVTGSFFLAGELRVKWFPDEKVLKTRKSF